MAGNTEFFVKMNRLVMPEVDAAPDAVRLVSMHVKLLSAPEVTS